MPQYLGTKNKYVTKLLHTNLLLTILLDFKSPKRWAITEAWNSIIVHHSNEEE